MSDMVKIKVYVGTGFASCSHEDIFEHPRDEWEAMTEKEREDLLDEYATDYRNERCECSAWVIED